MKRGCPTRTDGHLSFLETLARLLPDRRRALALVACIGFALLGMAGTALAATPVTETFSTPGGPYSFTVPAGVTSIRVHAIGGRGGDNTNGNRYGGSGADVTADLSVTPGQTLYVYVAGNGSYAMTRRW